MVVKREKNPLWFKNAVIYQMHVKSFYDRNEDGIGDFVGLTERLDYIESLGTTAIWLLPFFPSPLKDDGYDIASYYGIHPDYGTLKEFRDFLKAAHKRGIRLIIELVVNHTSDQHEWFQRARHAPKGSSLRDFYVWSDTPDRYKDARIIFKDFEPSNWSWDPVAESYYFHRFYSHQPDLNFDNRLVQKEVFKALDFWFEMGVDGLRLDAVPYLFEREGTNCENLPETHEFLRVLRKHVDDKFTDKVLIAEANQWPEDAAAYFGKADECHMAFHFPVMPRLFMAVQMEDRFPIIDILEQTPQLPEPCQWIMFLRNHDELTLEMVSDEERDYMYRIYAKDPKARINLGIRRRLAPLLDNDRAKIELMHILLFSLPGTPVIYYGDEIGMGDNYYLGDRNGVRTPMQWNPDRNAGFSKVNPQKLYLPVIIDPSYHYELVNVENQEQNPSSLLWWIRRSLAVRKNYDAFGSGTFEVVSSDNHKVLTFIRSYEDELILVVVNLSRFSQACSLDLSKYSGYLPRELFHQNPFPPIKEDPYSLTLGPYGYYWLALKPGRALLELATESEVPRMHVDRSWKNVLKGNSKKKFEKEVLPRFLRKARWFAQKTLTIQQAKVISALPFEKSLLCVVEVSYQEKKEVDCYFVPLSFGLKSESEQLLEAMENDCIAMVKVDAKDGFLYESIHDESFCEAVLGFIMNRRSQKVDTTTFAPLIRKGLKQDKEKDVSPRLLKGEQSNSSIIYGQEFYLKFYRRLEDGINPDVEINRFLTEKTTFDHIPKFAGSINWKYSDKSTATVALLQELVPNQGSGWDFTLDSLSPFYEKVLALKDFQEVVPTDSIVEGLIGGTYLDAAQLMGQRTAEMHIALGSNKDGAEFKAEPFSYLYQRSLYQDMRSNMRSIFQSLKNQINKMPESLHKSGREVLAAEQDILHFLEKLLQKSFSLSKIRIHGDYHLGQLLYTGKDFVLIDFEGEPLHSFAVRRRKRSVLRDVAGMLRSFHYAAYRALFSNTAIRPEVIGRMEPWANLWCQHVTKIYLKAYFDAINETQLSLVPKDAGDCTYLLQAFVLNKAIYELGYELNVRPDWLVIPFKGILTLLEGI